MENGTTRMRDKICCLSCYKDAEESLDQSGYDGDSVGSGTTVKQISIFRDTTMRSMMPVCQFELLTSFRAQPQVRIKYRYTEIQTMEENILNLY